MVGNANEVAESVDVLHGGGPPRSCRSHLSRWAGDAAPRRHRLTRADARLRLERRWTSGAAMEKFEQVVVAQGGDPRRPPRHVASATGEERARIRSAKAGYVVRIDAFDIGMAALRLGRRPGTKRRRHRPRGRHGHGGEGRRRIDEPASRWPGLFWNDEGKLADALPMTEGAFEISEQRGTPLVYGEVAMIGEV